MELPCLRGEAVSLESDYEELELNWQVGRFLIRMSRIENIDDIVERYCVSSNPFLRRLYFGLGLLFIVFAIIGIWVPGWPTVSWAVPAAFLFSYSSERMFRWTLTNRFFGTAMLEYYATGKTIPRHAKSGIIALISLMSTTSAVFVWYVSTLGDGRASDPSTWDGADPGFGSISIVLVGVIGIWYVSSKVRTREIG